MSTTIIIRIEIILRWAQMLNDFFLLVYGKIFLSECKKETDMYSAKLSSIMQLSLLISLNLLALLFIFHSFLGGFYTVDLAGQDRGSFMVFLLVIMAGVFLGSYFKLSKLYSFDVFYEKKLLDLKKDGSNIPLYANAYPYFVVLLFMISIVLLATSK